MRTTKRAQSTITLAMGLGDALPCEFRIFREGVNSTTKGDLIFDELAAQYVMEAFDAHGVDVMIDLEHLSLDERSPSFDPDARGWCKLAVRNGELWAVDVKWTPDGAERLKAKRQRYVSPCIHFDDDRRIVDLLNIGLVAMPATDNAQPLMAAKSQRLSMDEENTPNNMAAIITALGLGPDATLADIVAAIGALMRVAANPEEAEPSETAVDVVDTEELGDDPDADDDARDEKVAAKQLRRLSGKPSNAEALRAVRAWRKSHLQLSAERAKLAKEKAILEAGERRSLVARMVTLGAERPATAWADYEATKPAEPWASMPMAALRARVAKLSSAPASGAPSPGQSGAVEAELSERELAACKAAGADPKVYLARKIKMEAARKR